jgi:starch synthase
MIASEAAPFARTGGLGDVVGALPAALAGLGHSVKVAIPRYSQIDTRSHHLQCLVEDLSVPDNGGESTSSVECVITGNPSVEYLFLGNVDYFGRTSLYVDPRTGRDYVDNDLRFAFHSNAALEVVRCMNWRPDIVHIHDWQAALVPAYLKYRYQKDGFFDRTRTVLTIHNLGYQGLFEAKRFEALGLPEQMFYAATGDAEFFGRVNFLKAGIRGAAKVTTVSERYAEEVQTGEEFGCGLEGVLKDRSADLVGILNGVDYSVWSPKTDRLIPRRYWPANMSGKRMSKVELMSRAGLPLRDKTPLVGMVTRLVSQKGIDLLIAAAEDLMALDLQMIVLGKGDQEYHKALQLLEKKHPDRLKVYLEFNDMLAHRIQAGADIFLMPSRYEPCGLNQLYALKYGTVPVVRSVGGLADTVIDYDPATQAGTGFVFEEYEAGAMMAALERAVKLYPRRQRWTRLMKTGMSQDFSWSRSASKYSALFESLAAGV